jgi:cell division protein ZipA
MDSDQLRLVLLVLGIALVAGIYLWDRYKRSRRDGPPIKMARNLKEPDFDLPEVDDDVGEVRVRSYEAEDSVEPYIGASATTEVAPESFSVDVEEPRESVLDDEPSPSAAEPLRVEPASLADIGLQLEAAKPADGEPEPLPLDEGMAATRESQFSLDLEFNAHGDSDYLSLDPALMEEVPRLIVQINVMSKERPFSAAQIQNAVAQVDLKYGEMNIYHRETDAGQVLFSMASVVEPGTFPKGRDQNFSTPGMTLFTQLPGVRDGLAIYADMLFTAERLSAILDAVLQDERRHKLTKQSIEHTREGILEHRRQIQLLRSRH